MKRTTLGIEFSKLTNEQKGQYLRRSSAEGTIHRFAIEPAENRFREAISFCRENYFDDDDIMKLFAKMMDETAAAP